MSNVVQELLDSLGPLLPEEARAATGQALHLNIVLAVSGGSSQYSDDAWDKLSPEAREWVGKCVTAVSNEEKELPPPPGEPEPVESKEPPPVEVPPQPPVPKPEKKKVKPATVKRAPPSPPPRKSSIKRAATTKIIVPKRKDELSSSHQVREIVCRNLHLDIRMLREKVGRSGIKLGVTEIDAIYHNVHKVVDMLCHLDMMKLGKGQKL